jgi:hypothetical protein
MSYDLSVGTLWKSDCKTMNAPHYLGTMVIRKSLLKIFAEQLAANGYPEEIEIATALWLNTTADGKEYLSFQLSPFDDKKQKQSIPKKKQQPEKPESSLAHFFKPKRRKKEVFSP